MHNVNKEELVGDTSAANRSVTFNLLCKDLSTGSTYKLPLEASYAESLTKLIICLNSKAICHTCYIIGNNSSFTIYFIRVY
nr:palindromic element RPE1 domain-containing protein [Rickettsia canadensis]